MTRSFTFLRKCRQSKKLAPMGTRMGYGLQIGVLLLCHRQEREGVLVFSVLAIPARDEY